MPEKIVEVLSKLCGRLHWQMNQRTDAWKDKIFYVKEPWENIRLKEMHLDEIKRVKYPINSR